MIRLGSGFTGIGAWENGLKDAGIEYELKFFSEIDKYAIKSYCAIHNESEEKNIGDITKVDSSKLDDIDLYVYSPPCQAFSVAGKMLGVEDKRGVLFFDALRIIEEKKPKIAIMENVKGLTTKKFKDTFESMLSELERVGYKNYWKVLNLKDYGLPQNRERVFIVSIRNDMDKGFEFPKGYDNGLRLKDMLEDEVDEKYYISQDKVKKLLLSLKDGKIVGNIHPSGKGMNGNVYSCENIAPTITTNKGEGAKITVPVLTPDRVEKRQNGRRFKEDGEPMFALTSQDRHGVLQAERICGIFDGKTKHQAGSVWNKYKLSPTLDTIQGGWRQPCILVKEATKKGVRRSRRRR